MRTQFIVGVVVALFVSFTASAQQMPAQFNTPFIDVAEDMQIRALATIYLTELGY